MYTQLSAQHHKHIAAIIPCYTIAGDTTTIITMAGEQKATTTRIRTVINRLAHSHSTDLIALKQKTSYATERTILQPLPLAPGLVLCPIKVRIPRVSGDTSTGYINFHAVTAVTANHNHPYQSTIKLTGGTELPVLWKPSTVKKHLQYARLALSHSSEHHVIRPAVTLIAEKLIEMIYDISTTSSHAAVIVPHAAAAAMRIPQP